jgi:molybdate transport repressor ModE-like protein
MLYSTIGGRHGGGAELTPQAVRLVEAYRAYEADIKSYAESKFEESFGFYRELAQDPDSAEND